MIQEPNSACLSFCELGDQWLIVYANSLTFPSPVTLFMVGHCLESYCKSALLRIDPFRNVVGFGHNIERMLNTLKDEANLLQDISFHPDVENSYMTGGLIPVSETDNPEYTHYIQNQELYWTAKFQKELKYLGTPGKRMPTEYALFVMNRNPYWIPVLGELRSFTRDGFENESMPIISYRSQSNPEMFERQFVDSICTWRRTTDG